MNVLGIKIDTVGEVLGIKLDALEKVFGNRFNSLSRDVDSLRWELRRLADRTTPPVSARIGPPVAAHSEKPSRRDAANPDVVLRRGSPGFELIAAHLHAQGTQTVSFRMRGATLEVRTDTADWTPVHGDGDGDPSDAAENPTGN